MDKLSARFLSSYNEIDRFLRQSCKAGENAWFQEALDDAATRNATVRRFKDELKNYGRLRNAIVHNYHDDETIATPHERVVKRIETLKGYLVKPPVVKDHFKQEVLTCTLDTPVVQAVKRMSVAKYSQIPVYQGNEFHALLTTDTVARWFAATFDRDGGVLDETLVETVLRHAETTENCIVLGQGHSLFDILDQFSAAARDGRRLDAILITADGTKRHRPLAIITPSDVPTFFKTIE